MKFLISWLRLWQKTHSQLLATLAMICMLSLVATRVFWTGAFPYTHDGENHLARFANYFAAVREGQLPPRFAPHLFAGYGFPVFQYNYPFANILALPFMALKQNPEITYGILAFAAVVITAGSWYFFLRKRFSQRSSWVGVMAIIFSSVIQSNLLYRGNIGELWAIALASMLMALSELMSFKHRFVQIALFSVLTAAFLLSHNVLAVFMTPFLIIWQLVSMRKKQDYFVLCFSWILAGGLVLWFWLPALVELSLVVLSNDSLAAQAVDHTLDLGQIFLSPLRFGFSRPGSLDNLGWGWGVFVLSLLWVGIGQWKSTSWLSLQEQWKKQEARYVAYFITLFVFGCLMSSSFTTFVWESVPFLAIMQFPWRWLSIAVLGLPYMAALVFERTGKLGRIILVLSLFFWLILVFQMKPADRFHKDSLSYRQFPHTSLTRNENRPKTLIAETLPAWEAGPEILEGSASNVQIVQWTGSVHEYTIKPDEMLLVREKTVFFPGWVTRVNGKTVEPVFSEATGGLIAYYIPADVDEVRVKSSFTQRTTVRLISEVLFVISFVTVAGLLLWGTMMKKKV